MITFTVPGQPKAKGRARHSVVAGQVRTYTPEATRNYEGIVAHYASVARRNSGGAFEGPTQIEMVCTFERPKKWPKKKPNGWQISKPDADNVAKSILDGMVLGGLLSDDCIVCDFHVVKVIGDNPGVTVTVIALEP